MKFFNCNNTKKNLLLFPNIIRGVLTQFFIPLKKSLDSISEIKKIEDELSYANGFLKSVQKKLSNSKFVKNAPKNILDIEKKKALDTKEKIKILRKSLIKFN